MMWSAHTDTRSSTDNPAAPEGSGVAYLEQALWKRFGTATRPEDFASAWLALQCAMIPGVTRGVVVLGEPEQGPFVTLASHPEGQGGTTELSAAADSAMAERRGVVNKHGTRNQALPLPPDTVAYPILIENRLHGVVALEIAARPELQLRAVMRQLQWGAGWLEVLLRRVDRNHVSANRNHALVQALELTATSVEHKTFQQASTAVVTELATRLGCERVSLGFVHGRHVRVLALSHSAHFNKQANLVRAIGAAMDEALDQFSSLVYPAQTGRPELVTLAHRELAETGGAGAICTVPISVGDVAIGALPETVRLCEHVAALVGPVLDIKRREDRLIVTKAAEALRNQLARLIGPRHYGAKLVAILLIAVVTFLSVAEGDYRVSADATLEGSIQRVIVAPIVGYIKAAHARAGDLVAEGDPLVTMDDRDLRLEYLKWSSQKEQVLREHRDAFAQHDGTQVNILKAQLKQAEAQLELLHEQITRTRITAPFGGIIVSGDLSQQLGAPVERGQVLMEIAPLDSYRVILQVDEREVSDIVVGQRGQLILTALPGEKLPFVVEKVTPVSVTQEGQNSFRVEARLERVTVLLRPGMQGTGKVEIDRRKRIWIWTHKTVDWLHLWLWSWWP